MPTGLSSRTPQGRAFADFIIAGTGIEVDHRLRPELAHFAEHIATWNDRFKPPPGEETPGSGSTPTSPRPSRSSSGCRALPQR
jgi:hypothetical protein